jgi:hypothetical protein
MLGNSQNLNDSQNMGRKNLFDSGAGNPGVKTSESFFSSESPEKQRNQNANRRPDSATPQRKSIRISSNFNSGNNSANKKTDGNIFSNANLQINQHQTSFVDVPLRDLLVDR